VRHGCPLDARAVGEPWAESGGIEQVAGIQERRQENDRRPRQTLRHEADRGELGRAAQHEHARRERVNG
jgi:hypothetical protein